MKKSCINSSPKERVCVIGLGYIGLPTCGLLASKGFSVEGVDINRKVVKTINSGDVHIVEPKLEKYIQKAIKTKKFRAHTEIQESDIYIICVPTPFKKRGKTLLPDLNYVKSAANSLSKKIKKGDMVILESTSPVGTTELIQDIFENNGVDTSEIFISYCPERVLPGKIMEELVTNDRVIGGLNKKSTDKTANFYAKFVSGNLLKTDSKTAEMCKLVENSFRDVNIAFANELSIICEKNNINTWELIKLANKHPRVNILQPGIGVGGHCISVDPWFIVSKNPKDARLIERARITNDEKPKWVIDKIKKIIKKKQKELNKSPSISLLGLTFKPNIDDLRESPAVKIAEKLQENGINFNVVEPNLMKVSKFKNISIHKAIKSSDILLLLVGHKEFKNPRIKKLLIEKDVYDFCGLLS